MKQTIKQEDFQNNSVSVHLASGEDSALQQVFSGVLECIPDGWLQKYWGKPKGKYRLRISITDKHGLKIKDDSKVLQVELGSNRGGSVDFRVSDERTPFSVLFDPSQVEDGSVDNILKLQDDGHYKGDYSLDYEVSAYDIDNHCEVGTISNSLKVILHLSANVAKSYHVDLDPAVKEIEYTSMFSAATDDSDSFIEVATLQIRHSAGLRCAPSTNVSFKIEAAQNKSQSKDDGILLVLDNTQVNIPIDQDTESPFFKETDPVRPHGEVTVDPNATVAELINQDSEGYELCNLYGFSSDSSEEPNIISIPIQIDRKSLKNPEDSYVDVVIRIQHRLEGSESVTEEEIDIPLKKNTNLVNLRTSAIFRNFQGNIITQHFESPNSPNGMGTIKVEPIPLSNRGEEVSVEILFENTAETVEVGHEGAGVIISNFSLGDLSSANEDDISRIQTYDNTRLNVLSLFSVDGTVTDEPIVLHCSESSKVTLRYSARNIRAIKPKTDSLGRYIYSAEVEVPFTFKYIIDTTGTLCKDHSRAHWKEAQGFLHIHIEKSMSPEWLCVDFGTSAVVAMYGANLTRNHLLPINKYRREKIIPEAYPIAEAIQRKDQSEESDNFLPSVVYLNKDNEGDYRECKMPNDLSKSAIWFSPTTGMAAARLDYQLPSLKLMLGFEYLPDIFNRKVHENFLYWTKSPDGEEISHKLRNSAARLTEICKVDALLKIIYEQLFSYYLKPSIEDITNQNNAQLNKLILTIPNTFTPDNISILREMVFNLIPSLRYDQIRFVSESDAVACHYLSNESMFGATPKSGTEYLLVFDMGAGTLDLTYLKRERIISNEQNRQIITIEGKMGVNKAGNYLDFSIAYVIFKLLLNKSLDVSDEPTPTPTKVNRNTKKGKQKIENLMRTSGPVPSLGGGLNMAGLGGDLNSSIDTQESGEYEEQNNVVQQSSAQLADLVERIKNLLTLELSADQSMVASDNELKDYVCHKVKPLLSQNRNTKLPPITIGREFDVPLTVGDILGDDLFKSYISEITSDVLKNCRDMFANEEGEMPIDTLIFSGRSTQLIEIRKGVIEYLIEQNNNPQATHCKFADMGTMSYVDRNTGMTDNSEAAISDGLKTAVAKGALAYVSFFGGRNAATQMIGRNIYANYGILWNNAEGWHYMEILNRHTEPTEKAIEPTDGVYIDQYRVERMFNFSRERVLELMLIQTYSKDPLREWNNYNYEMISVLVSINNCSEYNEHEGNIKIELEVNQSNRFIFRIGGSEITVHPHVDFNDSALKMSIWPVLFSVNQ